MERGALMESDDLEGFSAWTMWDRRNALPGIKCPGIYVIARSDRNIQGRPFRWREEIIYIGMTNSIGGLRSRLKAFDDTLRGRESHGGAQRVRFKYSEYASLAPKLFVAISPMPCIVDSNRPEDLRIMGDIVKQEYECFACFAERFSRLPEFNDKKRSLKRDRKLAVD